MAAAEAKKGRPVTGRVFRRGESGVYYLRFRCAGVERTIRLLDPVTQEPVTAERAARAVSAQILAPFRAREVAALRESVSTALRTAQQTVQEAQQIAAEVERGKTAIERMAERYPPKTTLPKPGRKPRPLKPGTIKGNVETWAKFARYMAEKWPDVRFADGVTGQHCTAFSEYMLNAEKLSRHRHNMVCQLCGAFYRRAGLPNPFDAVTLVSARDDHETREPLTDEELRAVCMNAGGELRTLLALAVYTGLRLGDLCTMRWGDNVKLPENRLIRKTAKRGAWVGIPLHPELRAILEETPETRRRGYVLPGMAESYRKDPSAVSKIVTKHFDLQGLSVRKGADAADAQRRRAVNVRGMHALRHTFVSICARRGIPEGAVAAWVGHSPLVDRLYQHWGQKDTDASIMAALPAAFTDAKALPAGDAADERAELIRRTPTAPAKLVRRALAILKGGEA